MSLLLHITTYAALGITWLSFCVQAVPLLMLLVALGLSSWSVLVFASLYLVVLLVWYLERTSYC
ncbi:hypothetical protein [Vibrio phage vB_ValA_R15Z]|uniref:Uncharacterized protein n=1 Tax=Vibrio phage vB_ValA_R15Z TaxID=3044218 RepID=A0AA50AEH4_9CAUD|nr:hypothetical protein [Vibrio phage vB_ValA_R15Z]